MKKASEFRRQAVEAGTSLEDRGVDGKRLHDFSTDKLHGPAGAELAGAARRRVEPAVPQRNARRAMKADKRDKTVERAAVEVQVRLEDRVRKLLISGVDLAVEFASLELRRRLERGVTQIDASGEPAAAEVNASADAGKAQIEVTFDNAVLETIGNCFAAGQRLCNCCSGDLRMPIDRQRQF